MTREYLALVVGRPRSQRGTINAPIGRDRKDALRHSLDTDTPREAVTHFEVEELLPRHALLRVRLETGRTHQIRVHLTAIDLPVAGDPLYGRAGDLGLHRQFLHAARLAFPHPITGEAVDVSSPLPADLEAAPAALSTGLRGGRTARRARGRTPRRRTRSVDRERRISPELGSSERSTWCSGFQRSERIERLRALRVGLLDRDEDAERRHLPLDRAAGEQLRVVGDRRARPLTRNVSPTPGIRKSSAIRGSASRFVSVSAIRLPGRSGRSSVRSSRIRTNPAGSPRGETSSPPSGVPRRHAHERRALDELPGQAVQPVGDLRDDELDGADQLAQLGLVLDRRHEPRIHTGGRYTFSCKPSLLPGGSVRDAGAGP